MSFNLSNISWGWVVLGVVIALAVAHGSSICVVTFYSGYLGLQVRGAPDTALINEFANSNARELRSFLSLLALSWAVSWRDEKRRSMRLRTA